MRTPGPSGLFAALPVVARERLRELARDVSFPAGSRVFEEGERADRFWAIHTGSVVLDASAPGRARTPVATLGHGDLLGCSWLFPPYAWQFGAEAQSDVRAQEFDATIVRALCAADPVFGEVLARRVAEIIAHRLQSTRMRLLGSAAPPG